MIALLDAVVEKIRVLGHTISKTKQNPNWIMGLSIYDVNTEGEEGQAQVDTCGRGMGQRHVDVHIMCFIPLTSSCLMLMQRSWCFLWTRISSLDGIKSRFF